MNTLEHERERFSLTKRCVDAEMTRIDRRFAEGVQAGDEASEESVRALLERRWRILSLVRDHPYFARIDFHEDGKPSPNRLYLGKTTVMDADKRLLAVDWRAPVSSLYYESRPGRAEYDCPEGTVGGELLLKRQYAVESGELVRYDDIDITSDDELLRPYLTMASDVRLKNIIATIQSEQNRIIRADLGRDMIVQGSAGSGKTTVALHRIAYFVYTWAERFTPDRFMILAPNRFFLTYISPVLPDLGVEDVVQWTFEDMFRTITGIKAPVEDPVEGLGRVMSGEAGGSSLRAHKGSMRCKEELDDFVARWAESVIPEAPLVVGISEVYPAGAVAEMYRRQPSGLPVSMRAKDVKRQLDGLTRDMSGGRAVVREMLGPLLKPNVYELYGRFLGTRKPRLTWEDLTPLLYLYHKLYGASDRQTRHIIIDEAQDFSPFTLALLREIYPAAAFTVFGDLAQGIFPYRGIRDWEQVNREVFGGAAVVSELKKSYRTTVEIMEEAGKVLSDRSLAGQAFVRHGSSVSYKVALAPKEWQNTITEEAQRLRSLGRTAVIARLPESCPALGRLLGAPVVKGKDEPLPEGLCVVPAALSKGLEFDAVLIADAHNYSAKDDRLLYVAMTRAMHELSVVGLGGLGELIGA